MIPTPPLRSLFKSRWMALAWAGAICWMAVSFVGGSGDNRTVAANTDVTQAPGATDAKSSSDDSAAAAKALKAAGW